MPWLGTTLSFSIAHQGNSVARDDEGGHPARKKLFADDVKMYYSAVSTQYNASQLTKALGYIENWSESWHLKTNEIKCSVLRVGRGGGGG